MAKKREFQGSPQAKREREEANELIEHIRSLVYKAQYKKAFEIAKKGIERFPENRFVQYEYVTLLGDSKDWAGPKLHKENTKRAAKLLKSLLKRTSGIDPRWIKAMRNEYYWFSRQPIKQWRMGQDEVVKKNSWMGYYSMGVGAVCVSLNCYEKGRRGLAVAWARKGVKACEKYFKHLPNYYNTHVWHARALGLSGDLPAMEKALKKAAKLAKRSLSYREFVDARKAVLEALGKAHKPRQLARK